MSTNPPPSARRVPLWVTLLPLLFGIGLWLFLWSGYRDRFEAALVAAVPQASGFSIGGFPYRLEAQLGPTALDWRGEAATATLRASDVLVHRQPWREDRQVINLRDSTLSLGLAPLAGISAGISAAAAQASLRTADNRIARLSIVWEKPSIRLGFLNEPVAASTLEVHFRETPAETAPGDPSPVLPVQDQLVLRAAGLTLGEGSPLSLTLEAELTAGQPIRSLRAWREGGTAEIRDLVVSDATGEVLRLAATVSPGSDGRLLVAGTITTVCPASVRAALAGLPPVTEKRARRPVSFAFTAIPGITAEAPPADPGKPPPVRAQEPDCPRLR